MDLSTIEGKLDCGAYQSVKQFEADFKLMWDNCREYNGQDSEYTEVAKELDKIFQHSMKQYGPKRSKTHSPDNPHNMYMRGGRSQKMENFTAEAYAMEGSTSSGYYPHQPPNVSRYPEAYADMPNMGMPVPKSYPAEPQPPQPKVSKRGSQKRDRSTSEETEGNSRGSKKARKVGLHVAPEPEKCGDIPEPESYQIQKVDRDNMHPVMPNMPMNSYQANSESSFPMSDTFDSHFMEGSSVGTFPRNDKANQPPFLPQSSCAMSIPSGFPYGLGHQMRGPTDIKVAGFNEGAEPLSAHGLKDRSFLTGRDYFQMANYPTGRPEQMYVGHYPNVYQGFERHPFAGIRAPQRPCGPEGFYPPSTRPMRFPAQAPRYPPHPSEYSYAGQPGFDRHMQRPPMFNMPSRYPNVDPSHRFGPNASHHRFPHPYQNPSYQQLDPMPRFPPYSTAERFVPGDGAMFSEASIYRSHSHSSPKDASSTDFTSLPGNAHGNSNDSWPSSNPPDLGKPITPVTQDKEPMGTTHLKCPVSSESKHFLDDSVSSSRLSFHPSPFSSNEGSHVETAEHHQMTTPGSTPKNEPDFDMQDDRESDFDFDSGDNFSFNDCTRTPKQDDRDNDIEQKSEMNLINQATDHNDMTNENTPKTSATDEFNPLSSESKSETSEKLTRNNKVEIGYIAKDVCLDNAKESPELNVNSLPEICKPEELLEKPSSPNKETDGPPSIATASDDKITSTVELTKVQDLDKCSEMITMDRKLEVHLVTSEGTNKIDVKALGETRGLNELPTASPIYSDESAENNAKNGGSAYSISPLSTGTELRSEQATDKDMEPDAKTTTKLEVGMKVQSKQIEELAKEDVIEKSSHHIQPFESELTKILSAENPVPKCDSKRVSKLTTEQVFTAKLTSDESTYIIPPTSGIQSSFEPSSFYNSKTKGNTEWPSRTSPNYTGAVLNFTAQDSNHMGVGSSTQYRPHPNYMPPNSPFSPSYKPEYSRQPGFAGRNVFSYQQNPHQGYQQNAMPASQGQMQPMPQIMKGSFTSMLCDLDSPFDSIDDFSSQTFMGDFASQAFVGERDEPNNGFNGPERPGFNSMQMDYKSSMSRDFSMEKNSQVIAGECFDISNANAQPYVPLPTAGTSSNQTNQLMPGFSSDTRISSALNQSVEQAALSYSQGGQYAMPGMTASSASSFTENSNQSPSSYGHFPNSQPRNFMSPPSMRPDVGSPWMQQVPQSRLENMQMVEARQYPGVMSQFAPHGIPRLHMEERQQSELAYDQRRAEEEYRMEPINSINAENTFSPPDQDNASEKATKKGKKGKTTKKKAPTTETVTKAKGKAKGKKGKKNKVESDDEMMKDNADFLSNDMSNQEFRPEQFSPDMSQARPPPQMSNQFRTSVNSECFDADAMNSKFQPQSIGANPGFPPYQGQPPTFAGGNFVMPGNRPLVRPRMSPMYENRMRFPQQMPDYRFTQPSPAPPGFQVRPGHLKPTSGPMAGMMNMVNQMPEAMEGHEGECPPNFEEFPDSFKVGMAYKNVAQCIPQNPPNMGMPGTKLERFPTMQNSPVQNFPAGPMPGPYQGQYPYRMPLMGSPQQVASIRNPPSNTTSMSSKFQHTSPMPGHHGDNPSDGGSTHDSFTNPFDDLSSPTFDRQEPSPRSVWLSNPEKDLKVDSVSDTQSEPKGKSKKKGKKSPNLENRVEEARRDGISSASSDTDKLGVFSPPESPRMQKPMPALNSDRKTDCIESHGPLETFPEMPKVNPPKKKGKAKKAESKSKQNVSKDMPPCDDKIPGHYQYPSHLQDPYGNPGMPKMDCYQGPMHPASNAYMDPYNQRLGCPQPNMPFPPHMEHSMRMPYGPGYQQYTMGHLYGPNNPAYQSRMMNANMGPSPMMNSGNFHMGGRLASPMPAHNFPGSHFPHPGHMSTTSPGPSYQQL